MPPVPVTSRNTGSQSNLPPSVEEAYYRKCIELRRRITEIEEHNDVSRLRIKRLNRSVMKMRLERAFLLEELTAKMDHNVDESDRSTSPPPTPQDKPLRSKRSHRKTTPTPAGAAGPPSPSSTQPTQVPTLTLINAMPSSAQSSPDPQRMPANPFSTPGANGEGSESGVNGTQDLAESASGPGQLGLSISQAVSSSTNDDSERVLQGVENGTPAVDSASAPVSGLAAAEAREEVNGEKNEQDDTDMTDAPPGAEASGGFTAVNR